MNFIQHIWVALSPAYYYIFWYSEVLNVTSGSNNFCVPTWNSGVSGFYSLWGVFLDCMIVHIACNLFSLSIFFFYSSMYSLCSLNKLFCLSVGRAVCQQSDTLTTWPQQLLYLIHVSSLVTVICYIELYCPMLSTLCRFVST